MGDALGDIFIAIVSDDEAAAGNEIDEALESGFHGVEVGVDIGVVELDVGEDEGVWEVVEELWALIEEWVSYLSPSTMKVWVGRSWKLV